VTLLSLSVSVCASAQFFCRVSPCCAYIFVAPQILEAKRNHFESSVLILCVCITKVLVKPAARKTKPGMPEEAVTKGHPTLSQALSLPGSALVSRASHTQNAYKSRFISLVCKTKRGMQ
jgi:hypothetical protein